MQKDDVLSINLSHSFLEIDLYIQTRLYNEIKDKKPHHHKRIERLNTLKKYLKHFKKYKLDEVKERMREKFQNSRSRNFSILFDVPISYDYYFPKVLKLIIYKDFKVKHQIVQKGSSKRDLVYNNYEFSEET